MISQSRLVSGRLPAARRPALRADREVRVTPFLVLRLTPTDAGARPVMQAIEPQMRTLVVGRAGTSDTDVGFDLNAGVSYMISGAVTNFGQAPVLLGLARLFIADLTTLVKFWEQEEAVAPLDAIDFQVWPGQETVIRFRRPWVAPAPTLRSTDRISVFIHVSDLGGDRTRFQLTNTGIDRHIARRDFQLS